VRNGRNIISAFLRNFIITGSYKKDVPNQAGIEFCLDLSYTCYNSIVVFVTSCMMKGISS
jgi:hypothetical protein